MTAIALGLALLSASPLAQEAIPPRIELERDFDEAQDLARRTQRPLVVYFGAVWCSHCRTFEKRTLRALEVREAAVEFCWSYVEVDSHLTLANEYGVRATPHVIVLSPEGTRLGEMVGAVGPVEFRAFLDRFRAGTRAPLELESERDPAGACPAEESAAPEGAAGPAPGGTRTALTMTPSGFRAKSVCFSHVGYGPLNLPSQAPGTVFRPGFQPRVPSTLLKGQFEFGWSETVANVFAYRGGDYRLDYMTLNSVLSLGYGVSDTVLVEVEVNQLNRFASYLDPVTDAFHDLFGLGDGGRENFPSHDNVIDLELQDGVEIEDSSSGSESTNVALSLQHNLTCGTRRLPAISYGLDVSYHLGGDAELTGPSNLGAGLSGSLARRFGESWYAYLCVGHNWYGQDESRNLPLDTRQWSALTAIEWRHAARSSWILQYLVTEGVASDRDPFDDPAHEINLGWKREMSRGFVLEIGLIENLIEPDNSPDFGLHFAVRKRF